MPCGYFPNKVFDYIGIVRTKGTPKIVKKMFSLTTLVVNKFIHGKIRSVSQVSELLVVQENISISKEIEDIRVNLATKNAEII